MDSIVPSKRMLLGQVPCSHNELFVQFNGGRPCPQPLQLLLRSEKSGRSQALISSHGRERGPEFGVGNAGGRQHAYLRAKVKQVGASRLLDNELDESARVRIDDHRRCSSI